MGCGATLLAQSNSWHSLESDKDLDEPVFTSPLPDADAEPARFINHAGVFRRTAEEGLPALPGSMHYGGSSGSHAAPDLQPIELGSSAAALPHLSEVAATQLQPGASRPHAQVTDSWRQGRDLGPAQRPPNQVDAAKPGDIPPPHRGLSPDRVATEDSSCSFSLGELGEALVPGGQSDVAAAAAGASLAMVPEGYPDRLEASTGSERLAHPLPPEANSVDAAGADCQPSAAEGVALASAARGSPNGLEARLGPEAVRQETCPSPLAGAGGQPQAAAATDGTPLARRAPQGCPDTLKARPVPESVLQGSRSELAAAAGQSAETELRASMEDRLSVALLLSCYAEAWGDNLIVTSV